VRCRTYSFLPKRPCWLCNPRSCHVLQNSCSEVVLVYMLHLWYLIFVRLFAVTLESNMQIYVNSVHVCHKNHHLTWSANQTSSVECNMVHLNKILWITTYMQTNFHLKHYLEGKLVPVYTTKASVDMEVWLHSLLTLAWGGRVWSASRTSLQYLWWKNPQSRKASDTDWVLSKQAHNPARFQIPLPSNP
jgi:hypothetical protein